jgi:hypothetical protein
MFVKRCIKWKKVYSVKLFAVFAIKILMNIKESPSFSTAGIYFIQLASSKMIMDRIIAGSACTKTKCRA